jgi:hypothetical protein
MNFFSNHVFAAISLSFLTTIFVGCENRGPVGMAVSGTITFQGNPVAEGSISFEDKATGNSASATIEVGGKYQVILPSGDYVVWIVPPMVTVAATPDSPPDEQPKDVADIPKKYRSSVSSGLSAKVTETAKTHDFELAP